MMKLNAKPIRNLSSKRLLYEEYYSCDNWIDKGRGIMLKTRHDSALLFEFPISGVQSIHSLFCPNFDAVFLDHTKRIVQLNENFRMFRVAYCLNATYILELPPNHISLHGLKVGDVLDF